MKQFALIFMAAVLASCILTGCSGRKDSVSNTQAAFNLADVEPIYLTQWPDNEYTSQIPEPTHGKINYVYDLSDTGRYALFLKDISEDASKDYIGQLKGYGYTEMFSDENAVSAGTVLAKENSILTIAYSDGMMSILVAENE